jgi:hypothetical protein
LRVVALVEADDVSVAWDSLHHRILIRDPRAVILGAPIVIQQVREVEHIEAKLRDLARTV